MKIVTASRMNQLAQEYRDVAHRLHVAAASFASAADYLQEGRLQLAEDSARKGLDAVEGALEQLPKAEEMQHV